jgi:hypothetical protein
MHACQQRPIHLGRDTLPLMYSDEKYCFRKSSQKKLAVILVSYLLVLRTKQR